MANAKSAFVFSHSPGMNALWHSPYGICREGTPIPDNHNGRDTEIAPTATKDRGLIKK